MSAASMVPWAQGPKTVILHRLRHEEDVVPRFGCGIFLRRRYLCFEWSAFSRVHQGGGGAQRPIPQLHAGLHGLLSGTLEASWNPWHPSSQMPLQCGAQPACGRDP